MIAPVTRGHRELAVNAMYPHCVPGSPMWDEFVENGDDKSYRTPARVAQAIADAQATPVAHAGQQIDIDLVYKALYTGQVSAAKVDAQRAFERLVARWVGATP